MPAFTTQDLTRGKYSALAGFETMFPLPAGGAPDPGWFLARVGRTAPPAAVRATLDPLAAHWDHVADVLRAGPAGPQPALGRFWQELPELLEKPVAEKHRRANSWKLTSPLRLLGRRPRGG